MSSFCDELAEDPSDKPRHGTTDWENNPLFTAYNVVIGGTNRHVSLLNLRRRDEGPDVPWNGNPAQIILDCLCAKMPSVSALLLTQAAVVTILLSLLSQGISYMVVAASV